MPIDGNVFFERQLDYVKTKAYETKTPENKGIEGGLLPVSFEAGEGANSVTYRTYEGAGVADFIGNYAQDVPKVKVTGIEQTVPVHQVASSYTISDRDLARSQMAGTNLETRTAMICKKEINNKLEDVAWNGDADYGLFGMLTYPNTQIFVVANDGTGTTTQWENKTPDQILRDLNDMVTQVLETTLGLEKCDTIVMPIKQYQYINTTARSSTSDTTILQYFLNNNMGIKVDWINQMKGAGTAGADVMMAYVNKTTHVTAEIPQPFKQGSTVQEVLKRTVPCTANTGGVIIYTPLAVIKGEGI